MSNHELLLAISEMMDSKLKAELEPIKRDIQVIKEEQKAFRAELQEVKEEQKTFRAELQEVKEEQKAFRAELQELKAELQEVKEEQKAFRAELQEVKAELQEVKAELQEVKDEVRQIKLCQENEILPRLNTIEACYTSTYNRYKEDAEKMEAAFEDIEMLKKVVADHSKKLQKLA